MPSIEVLVINDLNQSFIPMLHLSFAVIPNVTYFEEMKVGRLDAVCVVELEFFNPSVGKMEPIIEEASFVLKYAFNDKLKEKAIDIR